MADNASTHESSQKNAKSAAAFRTISEVATELDLPQHVLRFWETKFQQIKPLKRGGGRRYYRPEDVLLLRRIRDLLYMDGYTIKGVQKLLRQSGGVRNFVADSDTSPTDGDTTPAVAAPGHRPAASDTAADPGELSAVIEELKSLKRDLQAAVE